MNKLSTTRNILAGTSILAASVIMPISQMTVLTAQANYSPLSAPISAPVTSPSPTPSSAPISAPETSPEPTATPTPDQNQNSGSSNSDNGGSSAPSCNSQKPASAPILVSWEAIGKNQIRLNWTKAQNPVNYYLVNYGLKAHTPLYGNPNVGDQNTTSTVIGGLSGGTTYYFTVAAGNDCVHSDNSNELAVKINGVKLNTPVSGFNSKNILSASTVAHKVTQSNQTPAVTQNQPQVNHSNGFFNQIANFFGSFFKH